MNAYEIIFASLKPTFELHGLSHNAWSNIQNTDKGGVVYFGYG
jgi:hypothetical protein